MKNQIVFILTAIVLSKTGFSQDLDKSAATGTPYATVPQSVKKNEISLDLIPLVKMMSLSEGNFDLKGTLQYKRQLKPNWFLRVSFTAIQERKDRPYTNIRVLPSDLNNDMVLYSGTEYKPELNLNTGIEYRWGKGRFKQFAGMDIGYVHREKVYCDYIAYVPKYSNYDPNSYAHGYNGPGYSSLYSNPWKKQSYAQEANGVMITPFYGAQYNFSKRFFLSAQLGVGMGFLVIRNKPVYSTPPHLQGRVFEFNLAERGILNNFSIGFRF